MLSGRRKLALVLTATGALAGCAQTGPILPRRTTLGSLKTSVSHLEYENEQLRREVAQLQSENRDIENRLVQEQAENGEISARLDDARYELSRRGLDFDAGRSASTPSSDGPKQADPWVTRPAGRSNRKPRKPPFARIPGRIEDIPPADSDDPAFADPKRPDRDAFGPQGLLDDSSKWLPIARIPTAPATKVR